LNILVIDTATRIEIVAAASNDTCAGVSSDSGASHAVTLIDSIDRCLAQVGLLPQDIELIGVGIGPGSFTGIRIAVAAARMMAQVLERPLLGFPTPLLYAAGAGAAVGDEILVAFDAKKGRVFGALYAEEGTGIPRAIVPPGDYDIAGILRKANPSATLHCIGDGVARYRSSVFESDKRVKDVTGLIPPPEAACRLARIIYDANPDACADWSRTLPFYARKSDAEIFRES